MGIKTDVSKIIGQRFGRLTIIGDAGQNGRRVTQVLTRCDCGSEKILLLQTLKSGLVISCGCYNREKSTKNATTHGMNRTPLHKMWKGMKSRCYNKNMKNYIHYGGRGISVCDEWRYDFKAFHDFAINNGWESGLEIDRTNNDLGYCPGNCRFVTHKENCNNRRENKRKNRSFGIVRSKNENSWIVIVDKRRICQSVDPIEAVCIRIAFAQCVNDEQWFIDRLFSVKRGLSNVVSGERNTLLKLRLAERVEEDAA